jgi:hypothetical protein
MIGRHHRADINRLSCESQRTPCESGLKLRRRRLRRCRTRISGCLLGGRETKPAEECPRQFSDYLHPFLSDLVPSQGSFSPSTPVNVATKLMNPEVHRGMANESLAPFPPLPTPSPPSDLIRT